MAEGVWDVKRHHAELLRLVLGLMAPGGLVFFSTNFRKFKIAADEILCAEIREISAKTVPPDFHDRKIHRCWRLSTALEAQYRR